MQFKRTALRGPKGARWQLTGRAMLVDNKRGPVIKVLEAELIDTSRYKPHTGKKQLFKAQHQNIRALIAPNYTAIREDIVARYPETLAALAE